MTIVQPGNRRGDARAAALGGRGRGGERRDPARDRAVAAADRARRRAPSSDGDASSARAPTRSLRLRPGDAARGAHRRRAARRAGLGARGREHAVAQPLRRASGSRELVEPSSGVFVLEDHAPVGGLGDALRRELDGRARRRCFGVEGWPACGTPAEALACHGLDGASLAGRIEALLGARVMARRPVWLVLPDPLSIRLFFDTGIVSGFEDGSATGSSSSSPDRAEASGLGAARARRPCCTATTSSRCAVDTRERGRAPHRPTRSTGSSATTRSRCA